MIALAVHVTETAVTFIDPIIKKTKQHVRYNREWFSLEVRLNFGTSWTI